MDTWSLFEPSSQDFAVSGTENDPFFDLIQSLLNTGAAINPDVVGRSCSSVREWETDLSPFIDGHSPLTAASKYRHKQLVDVFLQRGADVRFLTNRDASALHECLYSWEEMNDTWQLPRSFSERGELFPGSGNLSSLVDVARSLISAGAAVNDESGFSFKPSPSESDLIYCTTLDLGVLTGSVELVDMMLGAGACTTTKVSLEHAIYEGWIETVTRLLILGAPLSIEAIGELVEGDESFYAISLLRPSLRVKRAMFQQAIRLGATSTIEYFLSSETSNPQKLFYDMTEAFQQCCAEGHINTLRLLLNKSSTFKVSICPWFGRAIEVAIENGHDDILDILLSAGPDVDVIVHRESVLLAALRKKNTRIIRKLIRAGMRLSERKEECSKCKRIHESNDVLIAAINLGDYHVINSLIDAGASLHTLGTTDCMLGSKLCILRLTAAIVGKDLTLVNHLIFAGAAMNNPPESASTAPTPLSAAIATRDLELVHMLIQRGSNPYDSLALAEATNEFRLLQTLLIALHDFNEPNESCAMGRQALCKAVKKQNLLMVRAILNSPLRDMKSNQGLCAGLIQAAQSDSTPNFEIIRTFLSLDANLNSVLMSYYESGRYYSHKNSALCFAIEKNDSRKVELLLEAGGRADTKQTKNLDPPILCAISGKNSDILRKLLEHGLDPNKYSGFPSQTPIELATGKGDTEMIKILLQYGVNPNTSFKGTPHTPLQIASRDGNREVIDLLLEHGADVNSPAGERCGATALQFAAIKGFLGIAFLLLENGADVNAPPAEFEGRTALEGAAEHGRIDMVQLLLNAGANIFHEGQAQYENAVRRASENGHCAVRRLLESYHG
jgi:ankyrin repeat protein